MMNGLLQRLRCFAPSARVAFAAVAISAIALGLSVDSAQAGPGGGEIRVVVGMTSYEATIQTHPDPCGTDYWHCDEGSHPSNTSLDLTNAVGATANEPVDFQSYGYSGHGTGVISNHDNGISLCPGADVRVWIPYPDPQIGTWIGSFDYVQVYVNQTWGTQFYVGTAWTIQQLGAIAPSAPGGGCPWTGVHYHQSVTPVPYVYTNWPVENDDDSGIAGRQIYPTGSASDNFLHAISY